MPFYHLLQGVDNEPRGRWCITLVNNTNLTSASSPMLVPVIFHKVRILFLCRFLNNSSDLSDYLCTHINVRQWVAYAIAAHSKWQPSRKLSPVTSYFCTHRYFHINVSCMVYSGKQHIQAFKNVLIKMFILGDFGYIYFGYGVQRHSEETVSAAVLVYSILFYMPFCLLCVHFIYRYLSLTRLVNLLFVISFPFRSPTLLKKRFTLFMICCTVYTAIYSFSSALLVAEG